MRRPLRIFAGCLTLVAALGGIGVWRAHDVADATIAGHLASFRTSVARLRASPTARPALRLPEEAGDARVLVDDLCTAVESIPEADRRRVREFDPGSAGAYDPATERAVIGRVRTTLEGLDGLYHRSLYGAPPTELGTAPFPGSDEIRRIFLGWQALAAAIRHAREDGRTDAAIRLASDALLLGRDLGHARPFFLAAIGLAIERAGTIALAEILRDVPVGAQTLSALAASLEALRRVPASPGSSWELTWVSMEGVLADDRLFATGLAADPDLRRLRTWRTLYSMRLGRATALRTLESIPKSLPPELASEPWSSAAERTISALGLGADAPLLSELSLTHRLAWPAHLRGLRRQEAHLAALELAVGMARFADARGTWPATADDLVPGYLASVPISLLDPTGVRFAGGRAWSRGLDGDDDGGRPLLDPEVLEGDGDLVVEVKARR